MLVVQVFQYGNAKQYATWISASCSWFFSISHAAYTKICNDIDDSILQASLASLHTKYRRLWAIEYKLNAFA